MRAGWQSALLGELLVKTPTVDPSKRREERFTYIDVSSVSNLTFSVSDAVELQGRDAPSRARRSVREADVIFATVRPTLQRIAIIPSKYDGAVCSTGFFVMRAGPLLDPKYLYYWLFSDVFSAEMEKRQRGASYPAVTDGDIRDQRILLPPLNEQKRIVAVLDEAIAGIATASFNAELNLANVQEISGVQLARILENVEALETLPIDQLAFIQEGPGIRKYEYQDNGFPIINVRCVQDGWIDLSKGRSAKPELALGKWRHFHVDEGDILFTTSGTIGRCAIVKEGDLPLLMNTSVVRFRSRSKILDQRYLYHFLRSDLFQKPLAKLVSGTAIANVGPTHIKTLSIPIPTLDDQKQIIEILDSTDETVRSLVRIYTKKRAALDALKRSIIHDVFFRESPTCESRAT